MGLNLGLKYFMEMFVVVGATLEIGFFAARWNKKISARRRWNFFSDSQNWGLPPQKIKIAPLFWRFVRFQRLSASAAIPLCLRPLVSSHNPHIKHQKDPAKV